MRTNDDNNIELYSTAELETMKRRLAKNQSSVFSLSELETELEKRKIEMMIFNQLIKH